MQERNTFAISFYQRTDKVDKKKTVPIYMRITVKGQRAEIATNMRFDMKRWKDGRPTGRKADANELKNDLDNIKARINMIRMDMIERHEEVTAENIKKQFTGKDQKITRQVREVRRNNVMNFGED